MQVYYSIQLARKSLLVVSAFLISYLRQRLVIQFQERLIHQLKKLILES